MKLPPIDRPQFQLKYKRFSFLTVFSNVYCIFAICWPHLFIKDEGFSSSLANVFGGIFWKYKPQGGGAVGDETLAFGNARFTKKSCFEKCLVDFF